MIVVKIEIFSYFGLDKVKGAIDQLQAIRDQNLDDKTILRRYVKGLVTLNNALDMPLLYFEQFEVKPWLDLARAANQDLTDTHGYDKYTSHIDRFELNLCNYYLTNEEYGRLSRKYLTR